MARISQLILRSAVFAAATGLAGCVGEGPEVFDRLPPARSAEAAPWPKLASVPPAPPKGVYTKTAPDPAEGVAVEVELSESAAQTNARRDAVSGPVR